MSAISFSVEKMYRLPDAGSLKAFADVCVSDAIVIKGVRVMEGKKGLFVGLPREQGKDNKWYDQVVCRSADIYGELSGKVIEHYKEVQKN
ncbi:MAG: septation protein SpoVG family protein [Candidatus Omnitrophica bacterium]|nr:septation protein SpoVG family protein [Candidatus Omnitrophota bacterium]